MQAAKLVYMFKQEETEKEQKLDRMTAGLPVREKYLAFRAALNRAAVVWERYICI